MSILFDFNNYPVYVDSIFDTHGSAFIGGSYVVNPDNANDIDIYLHRLVKHVRDAIINAGYNLIGEDHNKYPEIDHERLIAVYEYNAGCDGPKANVIIVGAVFWPAYVGAVANMVFNKDAYKAEIVALLSTSDIASLFETFQKETLDVSSVRP